MSINLDDHQSTRVAIDAYHHRFICSCGFATIGCANGLPTAGADLVRHMLDLSEARWKDD